jgi:hypothetical protein
LLFPPLPSCASSLRLCGGRMSSAGDTEEEEEEEEEEDEDNFAALERRAQPVSDPRRFPMCGAPVPVGWIPEKTVVTRLVELKRRWEGVERTGL